MPKRNFRIVRLNFPMTGICENCNKRFISRIKQPEEAEQKVRAQFDAHKCQDEDASQPARIVREATENGGGGTGTSRGCKAQE
jgi:hypothetical protein